MTLDELANLYMASPRFKKLAATSQSNYEYALESACRFFHGVDIENIKRSDLIRFQTDNETRPGSANLFIRVISLVLEYALDSDLIPYNPAARLKKLKGGTHKKWTPEEVARAIALDDRRVSVAIALAWYTGQRESDVLAMRWADYDGEYITVDQQMKTGTFVKIKVHPDLAAYLTRIRNNAPPSHYIVSGEKKLNGSNFRGLYSRRVKGVLGIEKTFHGIRKGVACSLAEKGSSVKQIAAMLGHKTTRMAAFYADQAETTVLTDSAVGRLVSVG